MLSNRVKSKKSKVKRLKLVMMVMCAIMLVGCNKGSNRNVVMWGKTYSYEPFLWKTQVPDTLKRTLCFDFNDDAVRYMSAPLKLGVFKKDDSGRLRQVKADEMELFVNGKAVGGNIISVNATEREVEVGIVLSQNAENKMHYWYIKPIDNAGLDRINDKDNYGEDDAVMEIKIHKRHIMNPLAEGLMWIGIIFLAALILWFVLLKRMFFPTFRVTRLQLTGPEPYLSQLKIKGYRMCVLSANPNKQNWFNKVFAGEIKYETNQLWSAPVVFEPRDKKSVRIRPDKTYTADTRFLKTNVDYVIVNETTKAKTTMRIS